MAAFRHQIVISPRPHPAPAKAARKGGMFAYGGTAWGSQEFKETGFEPHKGPLRNPPWRQPRGKWMVSLVNSHTNAWLWRKGSARALETHIDIVCE